LWQQAGLKPEAIGFLWGEGVVAEIVLFAVATPLLRRVTPETLLLLALLGGVIRWTALGLTANFNFLVVLQLFHAATFCAAHIGAMYFLQAAIPTNLTARAQGLYSAISSGVAPALMIPLAGWSFEHFGAGAFFLMSLTAGLGTLAALMLLKTRPLPFDTYAPAEASP
jgi:MFS transporter, PPP family, 3-phenylpropionic acid transporter